MRDKIKYNGSVLCASLLIAIMLILSPYEAIGVPINWMLGGIFVLYVVIVRDAAKIRVDRKVVSILRYPIIGILFSLGGFCVLSNVSSLINQIIGLIIDTIILYFLWTEADFKTTFMYYNIVAYICCLFALFQIIVTIRGGIAPTGRFEFLQLVSGQKWVPETWGFRFNSLFSEPSYFAIFLLPVILANIRENKYINAGVFSVFVILSSSTLGLGGLALILAFTIGSSNITFKKKIVFIFILLLVTCGLFYIANGNSKVYTMLFRTLDKLKNSGIENNNSRIIGNIEWFKEYGVLETLIGVGPSQFQNYMSARGIAVDNYSNTIIMTLLQFGILGSACIFMYFVFIFKKCKGYRTIDFGVLMLFVMCFDSLGFSTRFYHLLYFAMFYQADLWKKE